jgi:hypothetical protein
MRATLGRASLNRCLPATQENADDGHQEGEFDDDQPADLMSALPIRLPARIGISIIVPALPVHHDQLSPGDWQKLRTIRQSQSCTSRTYQHLRSAVLTTGGAGCSSATREKP